ncbi:MAG: acyl-CoA synthetase, partial [Acidimicrobiales bacterium]
YLWDNADVDAVVFHDDFTSRIEAIRHRLPAVRCWLHVGNGPCPRWAMPYEDAATSQPVGRPRTTPVTAPWGRRGDDLLLVYTGGTTGMPKGVMWRQDDLFSVLNRTADVRYPEHGGPDDVRKALRAPGVHAPTRLLPGPPLMHGTGLFTAMSVLDGGGAIVMPAGHHFDAERLLDTIEQHRVTQLVIVGDAFAKPLLRCLDNQPDRWDLSSLWLVISSGVMWSEEVKAGLLRHQPRLLMVDSLGSSEALGVAQSRSSAKGTAGTGGFVLSADTRVLDEEGRDVVPGSGQRGLVAMRGRGPIGYYKDPDKSAATFRIIDGERWAVPGDFATVERGGVVKLLGRGSGC